MVGQIQSRYQYRTYCRSCTTRKIDSTVFAFDVPLMCYHSTSTVVSVVKCNAIGVEETSDRIQGKNLTNTGMGGFTGAFRTPYFVVVSTAVKTSSSMLINFVYL